MNKKSAKKIFIEFIKKHPNDACLFFISCKNKDIQCDIPLTFHSERKKLFQESVDRCIEQYYWDRNKNNFIIQFLSEKVELKDNSEIESETNETISFSVILKFPKNWQGKSNPPSKSIPKLLRTSWEIHE